MSRLRRLLISRFVRIGTSARHLVLAGTGQHPTPRCEGTCTTPAIGQCRHQGRLCRQGGDRLYKIAHSWLDPMVNPVQTALGSPLRTEALAYPINGAER
jgi:hypothetical protein